MPQFSKSLKATAKKVAKKKASKFIKNPFVEKVLDSAILNNPIVERIPVSSLVGKGAGIALGVMWKQKRVMSPLEVGSHYVTIAKLCLNPTTSAQTKLCLLALPTCILAAIPNAGQGHVLVACTAVLEAIDRQ